MDINCDDEIRFLDFIIELIRDIEVINLAKYQSLINLSYDDYYIDDNISS